MYGFEDALIQRLIRVLVDTADAASCSSGRLGRMETYYQLVSPTLILASTAAVASSDARPLIVQQLWDAGDAGDAEASGHRQRLGLRVDAYAGPSVRRFAPPDCSSRSTPAIHPSTRR